MEVVLKLVEGLKFSVEEEVVSEALEEVSDWGMGRRSFVLVSESRVNSSSMWCVALVEL